ncbi:hypothetical protein WICMUC_003776 [Wickerhamomyces mucosus]|uniref:Dihydrofolate synthetase n=1 Tax=Wickerhamomyces mucosus TaxID=1378264 RepID=A0A9P8PJS3_9ASCO|nr:hypothetical protein WICMUC_003776 [Wickerhamomyces mucosus]
MGIELGLTRITNLLAKLGNPHLTSNFIHVAGTNGKGSVCAYLSSILVQGTPFKIGRFTSPHLIYRHDSVTLNNKPVGRDLFTSVEGEIKKINETFKIGATEFEILTAIAFKIFNLEKVDIAVMEVGLGGIEDSTNVITPAIVKNNQILEKGVLVTGITKIGMDHENILGSTLKEIASQKAGIIKNDVPNVVDGSNEHQVLQLIRDVSEKHHSENYEVNPTSNKIHTSFGVINKETSPLKGDYQLQNLSIALKIIDILSPIFLQTYHIKLTKEHIQEGVLKTSWPGRLQSYTYVTSTGVNKSLLLDGAHNGSASRALKKYIDETYNGEPITFIIAVTKGKDLNPLLSQLIKETDQIIVTSFGKVDGMPWIKANEIEDLKKESLKYTKNVKGNPNVIDILENLEDDRNIIVCGSLYLVGELLRLQEDV